MLSLTGHRNAIRKLPLLDLISANPKAITQLSVAFCFGDMLGRDGALSNGTAVLQYPTERWTERTAGHQ